MERIVLLSNPCQEDQIDELLVACLRILFPDCEIEIQSRRDSTMEDAVTWRRDE